MIVINICKYEKIKLELVFTFRSIFFFRLRTLDTSYNFRNPIKCINVMLLNEDIRCR
jgi:hypothetical protein